MRACCCSLAGTRACDSCPNGMSGIIQNSEQLLQQAKLVTAMDPGFSVGVAQVFTAEDKPSLESKIAVYALKMLCEEAYSTAKSKGWHETPREDGTLIALMHSDLSEALEAMRKPDKKDEHLPDLNPVGLELADVLIRIFDYCGAKGIDLADCVDAKMKYNETRPHRHGGKKF